MRPGVVWLSAVCLAFMAGVTAAAPGKCKGEPRGWGTHIDWKSMDEGLAGAESQHKPVMVIIHKTWCGACKRLAPQFAASKSIAELSKSFVMVNCEDDEEPDDDTFKPDGGYIPRIMFLSPSGVVDPTLYNTKGSPEYKFYYSSPDMVREGMQRALGKHQHGSDEL